jgi:NAD+ diphosphatase
MTASDSSRREPLAAGTLNRAAEERTTPGLLDSARIDPASRVLVLDGDRAPLASPGALHWVAPEDAPESAAWAFLGRTAEGRPILLAAISGADAEPFDAPAGWRSLRTAGGDLADGDAAAFVTGLSLGRWLLDAPHCPACGALTMVVDAGWSRRCPSCGRQHFPRTDPAVIVAVTSPEDPDRLLLGSNALWGADRFSCFAGFVEAGESLEAAVVREVGEEAGVSVSHVRYRGSQAWPYPRSLMVGFLATADAEAAARPDGQEIVAVRWFSRDEIGAGLAGESDLVLPGTASIAHRLIRDWHRGAA